MQNLLKNVLSFKTKHITKQSKTWHLNWMRLPILVDSIAQLVERRSRNPKMRVQIPLETTNISLVSAVSD